MPVCYMILLILYCNAWIILQYIDFYHERIKVFHVKDAEFNPTGKQGVMVAIKAGLTGQAVSVHWGWTGRF